MVIWNKTSPVPIGCLHWCAEINQKRHCYSLFIFDIMFLLWRRVFWVMESLTVPNALSCIAPYIIILLCLTIVDFLRQGESVGVHWTGFNQTICSNLLIKLHCVIMRPTLLLSYFAILILMKSVNKTRETDSLSGFIRHRNQIPRLSKYITGFVA
jgi:hypothetical protein